MRRLRRVLRLLAKQLSLAAAELQDAWAVAAAEVTGLVTYRYGAPLWVAALSAGSVLGVRVAAGRLLPRDGPPPPEPPLTDDEKGVADLTVDGSTTEKIARMLRRTVAEVLEIQHAVYEKVGSEDPDEIRKWMRRNGYRPPRPSIPSQIVNNDIVRMTATIASLYAFWQRIACPLLNNIWPGLPCP